MDEKGKNLATKEDIEEITRKTEEVQQEFREGFELFSNDVKFKYKHIIVILFNLIDIDFQHTLTAHCID